jgi:hypothetical protein
MRPKFNNQPTLAITCSSMAYFEKHNQFSHHQFTQFQSLPQLLMDIKIDTTGLEDFRILESYGYTGGTGP